MGNLAVEIDDAVVLLLGAPSSDASLSGRLEGITRLGKLIFLLERETSLSAFLADDPNFVSCKFGPFSPRIYQEVATLVAAGLLTDSLVAAGDSTDSWERLSAIDAAEDVRPEDAYTTRNLALTELGRRYYDVLASQLPAVVLKELAHFKDRFATLPAQQLVHHMHENYPEYTKQSQMRGENLGQPPGHAVCG